METIHHRHQAHTLEQALDEETQKNMRILSRSITLLEAVHANTEQNKRALDAAMASKGKTPFVYQDFDPAPQWWYPTDATWSAARDSGTLSLLPTDRAQLLSRIDNSTVTVIETSHQFFNARFRMLSLVHLHPDTTHPNPVDGDRLLLAISDYQSVADHLAMVMRKSRIALSGKASPFDEPQHQ